MPRRCQRQLVPNDYGRAAKRHPNEAGLPKCLRKEMPGRSTLDVGKILDVTTFPSVHVCLPSDNRAARAARQSLRLLESYIPEGTIDDVNLLVTELVSNSVKHASLLDDEEIQVDANSNERGIRVEVTNPGGAELSNRLPEKAQESGWGLLLVTKIASRWGIVTNGRTLIWFEIDLDAKPFVLSA
jgi:anti-sigma regulatory factor (Ser/Thr protein kinase)